MPNALHLTIPEPCHANWQQMTPNEQGRHCMSCQKTVVDFSLMSDQEILQYISTASSSHVCGRFDNDQLNKTYEEKKKPPFSWRYAWNVIVAAFLLAANTATAQTKTLKKVTVTKKNKEPLPERRTMGIMVIFLPDMTLEGTVIDDSTGNPVSAASIRLKEEGGTGTGTAADWNGHFSFGVPGSHRTTLVISAVGYATREYEVLDGNANGTGLKIRLTPEVKEMAPVTVKGYGTTSCRYMMGGISTVRVTTIKEKVSREVDEWMPKKDVRLYPNPVITGNSVTVSLSLKETGTYRMELLDAAGRLVWAQNLAISQPAQTTTIPTEAAWSKGVYWLRVSSGKIKKVYQAKVLLQ